MASRKSNDRVTIKTVAQDAGVSVAAVSKVLRDAYGVSDTMRLKVRHSMEKLSYRPHASARGMRGQTYTVGVLMADMRNPFFPQLIDGIHDGFEGTQYVPIFGIGRGSPVLERTIVHAMVDRQIDGLIMIGQRLSMFDLESVACEVPIVVIGHHAPEATSFDSANNDDVLGGALVVEHLLAQGFKRPAMITQGRSELLAADVSLKRENGFSEAMLRAGFSQHQVHIAPADDGLGDVTATVRALLKGGEPPDSIFGWADYYALEVLSAVRALGFRVPEDIGVVGYDNSAPCAFTQNDLTSVDQQGREIGRQATRLLIERIKGRKQSEHLVLTPKVIARGSSLVPNAK